MWAIPRLVDLVQMRNDALHFAHVERVADHDRLAARLGRVHGAQRGRLELGEARLLRARHADRAAVSSRGRRLALVEHEEQLVDVLQVEHLVAIGRHRHTREHHPIAHLSICAYLQLISGLFEKADILDKSGLGRRL